MPPKVKDTKRDLIILPESEDIDIRTDVPGAKYINAKPKHAIKKPMKAILATFLWDDHKTHPVAKSTIICIALLCSSIMLLTKIKRKNAIR